MIVPLKGLQEGMKVRLDKRNFYQESQLMVKNEKNNHMNARKVPKRLLKLLIWLDHNQYGKQSRTPKTEVQVFTLRVVWI